MSGFNEDYRPQVIEALNARYYNAYDHGRCDGGMVVVNVDITHGISCNFFLGRRALTFFQSRNSLEVSCVDDVLKHIESWIGINYPNYIKPNPTSIRLTHGRARGKCSYRLFEYLSTSLISVGWSAYDYDTCEFELDFDHTEPRNMAEIERLLAKGVIATANS